MAQPYVNPLAAELVEDPATPPDLVFLHGFIVPLDDSNTRLFLTPVMNRWVDIPNDQVVHFITGLPVPTSPWPEDVIWVTRENGDNLRPTGVNLAVIAQGGALAGADPADASGGVVVNVNVGRGGSGPAQAGPGNDDKDGGDENNWNQIWPHG